MSLKVQAKTGTIFDHILGVLFAVACVTLALGVLAICLDVVMRYFLRSPLAWTVEAVSFSLLFITFLGTAWVLKKEKHVKMDLMVNLLNPRAQATLNIVTSILGAIMCLVLTWCSGHLILDLVQSGERFGAFNILQFSKAPLVAVIAVGSFLLFVQFLRRAYGYLGDWRRRKRVKAEVVEF